MTTDVTTVPEASAVVQHLMDALSRADLDAVAALADPDIVVIEPESLPYGGASWAATS